jgi:hypothetical protein
MSIDESMTGCKLGGSVGLHLNAVCSYCLVSIHSLKVVMSSLAQLLAGRKRDSPVWEYFVYDVACDKSICKVTESDKPSCNITLARKNSSNLVSHLRRVHSDAYNRYCEKEQLKKK